MLLEKIMRKNKLSDCHPSMFEPPLWWRILYAPILIPLTIGAYIWLWIEEKRNYRMAIQNIRN